MSLKGPSHAQCTRRPHVAAFWEEIVNQRRYSARNEQRRHTTLFNVRLRLRTKFEFEYEIESENEYGNRCALRPWRAPFLGCAKHQQRMTDDGFPSFVCA